METRAKIESFIDFYDAVHYLEHCLNDFQIEGWDIEQAQINLINNQWRVGIAVSRGTDSLEVINMEDTNEKADVREDTVVPLFPNKS